MSYKRDHAMDYSHMPNLHKQGQGHFHVIDHKNPFQTLEGISQQIHDLMEYTGGLDFGTLTLTYSKPLGWSVDICSLQNDCHIGTTDYPQVFSAVGAAHLQQQMLLGLPMSYKQKREG